jgi:hypothetical protein
MIGKHNIGVCEICSQTLAAFEEGKLTVSLGDVSKANAVLIRMKIDPGVPS